MRRVALVCDWYQPRRGGIEAHLHELATRLAAAGNDVHVITSTPGPGSSTPGVTIHRLEVPRAPWAEVAVAPVAHMMGEIMSRERIDVAHAHVSIVSPVALAGAFEAHRRGLASVVTFHSFVPATPVLAWFAGRLLGAGDWHAVMTAVSHRVVREVRAFAPAANFSVLPNAIDTGFWTPGPPREAKGPVSLVYAGRLQRKKRPFLLVDALAAIDRAQRVSVTLRIVGDGPLRQELEHRFRSAGLSEHVEFLGWQNRDQLREVLRSSHIFLSTATRESFGLAALEARAVGVPVVAVRDSAVSDFIVDGETGLLADDDAGFIRATGQLASDHVLRRRMATVARTAPVNFGWDRAMAMHDALYARATASRIFQLPSR